MICSICNSPLVLCICEDFDERVAELKASPYLAMDWAALEAARHLNKFEIERRRAAAKEAQPK